MRVFRLEYSDAERRAVWTEQGRVVGYPLEDDGAGVRLLDGTTVRGRDARDLHTKLCLAVPQLQLRPVWLWFVGDEQVHLVDPRSKRDPALCGAAPPLATAFDGWESAPEHVGAKQCPACKAARDAQNAPQGDTAAAPGSPVWRSDRKPDGEPTIGAFAIHAEDVIPSPPDVADDLYSLTICHVDSFPGGKGFVPAVRFEGRTAHNGSVHRGTGADAYENAREEGLRLLRARVEESRRDFEESVAREDALWGGREERVRKATV